MNEFESYEYVVVPRKDGKNRLKRLLFIILYVLFVACWLVFGLLTRLGVPLLALIPITTWILVFATWRYVNVEYEYVIESGIITFSKIYGGRSRKQILELDVRDAERILPLGEKGTRRSLDDFDPAREYFFASCDTDPEAYVALCIDEDGTRIAVTFSADDRLYRMIRYRNPSALSGGRAD